MFTVDNVIAEYYPEAVQKKLFMPLVRPFLRWILNERAFLDFAGQYPHLQGIEFIEQVFEYFHFSYTISDRQRERIPPEGKLIIIANHPIGSLDGLALLKLIHEVRPDVKIVANDLLTTIAPLRSLLLPVRNITGNGKNEQIRTINRALAQHMAVILFPAGEVSRLSPSGIQDGPWHQGFLKLALKTKAPILPIHIAARNSAPFYLASIFAKPISTLMLVREMFYQRSKQAKITIGEVIPYQSFSGLNIRRRDKARLFKKHVYRLGAGKRPYFATESSIALPERKLLLKKDIARGERLGRTPDGKSIALFHRGESSPVMREIGRLREMTFRTVGEGTGQRRDLDQYDQYYHHLVLWDEEELEIAGAYRFVDARRVLEEKGVAGLYSASLFDLNRCDHDFFEQGLELGRSFVQPKYWGKRSLDYLWYGIGAFLAQHPQFRYLFGPVSISNAMPQAAKELMIYFYKLYFSSHAPNTCSRNPFTFSESLATLGKEFGGGDYREDFKKLKTLLANLGTAVPALYKQYTELCEPGGVVFLDFNVDPAFSNCVDGLVIVDIERLKAKKRARYIGQPVTENEEPT